MEDPLPRLLVLSLFALASAFLSLAGSALSLARKSRLKLRPAKAAVIAATENPLPFMFALCIWNLAVRFSAGFLLLFFFQSSGMIWIPFIACIFTFIVFTELLPRAAAPADPEGILSFCFPAISLLSLPWKPLFTAAPGLFYPEGNEEKSDAEFRLALEEGEKSGAVESRERTMVEGVLYLGDRPVSAFMTHRSEICCLDIDARPEEIRKTILEHRAQRVFPVVRETRDNIAGVVSAEDLFAALSESEWKGFPSVMKAPCFIPETMSALKAFEAFRREGAYCLCVMDEYGGFAGTLRVGSLLEEIVGGFAGQVSGDAVILQADGSWLSDGSAGVDDLAKILGLESLRKNNSDYHTLAGFILKLAGDIPRTGECFYRDGYAFTVTELDGNRIAKVVIRKAVGKKPLL